MVTLVSLNRLYSVEFLRKNEPCVIESIGTHSAYTRSVESVAE